MESQQNSMNYMEELIRIEDSSQNTRINGTIDDKTPKFIKMGSRGLLKSQLLPEVLQRKDRLDDIKDNSMRHSINR